ncbi:hypothetical protein DB347_07595 [Opitutaceae bacterium EW11]|nr:hypothetical protein DB347_07595 [Opitutaceae bacterium EW11]
MRRRIAILSLFTAWLLATGSHWDLVQTFAWGRMMVRNVQVVSFRQALEDTFDGEKPCEICLAVAKAKQQQDASSAPPESKLRDKIPLDCQPVRVMVLGLAAGPRWPMDVFSPKSAEEAQPPVPPPRV